MSWFQSLLSNSNLYRYFEAAQQKANKEKMAKALRDKVGGLYSC
jgi:hypothetical protein